MRARVRGVSDMKVEYHQTHKDYFNAYAHVSARANKSTKWRYLATFSGAAFGFLLVIGVMAILKHYEHYEYLENEELSFGIKAIVLAFITLFIGLKIYSIKTKPLIFEKNGLYLSLLSFEIQKEYLVHCMAENRHEYRWKYVQEIEKTKNCIYIFLDTGVALYIPKHGFPSEEAYEAFYNVLNDHA